MKSLFVKSFIPDAVMLDIFAGNGIYLFEHNSSIYFLADAKVCGLITQELKATIDLNLKYLLKPVIYISMFHTKADFTKSGEEIAWGTYAWFAADPHHYIHYDDTPSGKLIMQNILS